MVRFAGIGATDVSDAVGQLYTMDHGMRSLYEPAGKLIGEALTVKVPPGDNWAIYAALQQARSGSVLVVDWRGYVGGCGAGVLALVRAIRRGLAGVVIDGAWRDVAELRAIGFPVYGRAVSAFSPSKREMGEVNVPVCCGGVIVEPGDVIVGDDDGVAVVPRRHARDVADALRPSEPVASIDDYPPDEELDSDAVGEIETAYLDAYEEHTRAYQERGREE
ncbi:RraA family protein [Rubrobacter tropicus]|nr:hypothetical protein [Rubrobacter tropicus]